MMNLFSCFHRPVGSADKGFGVITVEVEEELQPLQLRLEGRRAATEIDGGIQCPVGVEELLRHGVGIVEIGECGIGKVGADVQDPLRCLGDPFNSAAEGRGITLSVDLPS
jgi:hypothetical protein